MQKANFQTLISTLRKVLGAQAILTVPGRGYRFALPVDGAASGVAVAACNVPDAPSPATATHAATAATTLASTLATTPASTAPRLTNLPVAETLIGRDADTDALTQLLAEHRLVTVVGAGGIGKTRLAQAVARRLVGVHANGVWWVDLAALSSPEQLVPAIAAAAGVRLGAGDALIPLELALASRNTLLVLDNCEHLVGNVADLVKVVLANAANVRVLATSQESLNAPGEHVYRLDTLRVPPVGTTLDAARGFSALQLLEKRAQAVHQTFWLTESTIANAIELCQQLDGIALAIEMAAARLPILGSETVVARLADRLRFLRSTTRGAPARQQTLRATLDWSHSLLTVDEQAMLRRLSVFAGSFPLELVQQVTTTPDLDEWAALDALSGLVDKSLVQTDHREPPRYRLLETTRLYAQERLTECGETAATLERHGQVMGAVAETASREFWMNADKPWLERYASAYDDLEVAFFRASERGDAAVTAATGEVLDFLDQMRGGAYRARDRKLAAYPLIAEAPPTTTARLWSLMSNRRDSGIGSVSRLDAARKAVSAWRELGDRKALYRALCNLAIEMARTGDFVAAASLLTEAERIEDPQWPPRLRSEWPAATGWISNYRGDSATYLKMVRRCLELSEDVGRGRQTTLLRANVADAVLMAGDLDEAITLLRQSENDLATLDQPHILGVVLCNLGCVLLMKDEIGEARAAIVRALPLIRLHPFSGVVFNHLALLAARGGEPAIAAQLLGFADCWYAGNQDTRQPNEAKLAALAETAIEAAIGKAQLERQRGAGGQLTLAQAEDAGRRVLAIR